MNNQILSKLTFIEDQLRTNSRPLSLPEAADYLTISKSYLYKLTHKNKIPHYKPNGKKIYFLEKELNEWLTQNRVKGDSEIDREALNYIAQSK